MSARVYDFPGSDKVPAEVYCKCGALVSIFGAVPAVDLNGKTVCSRCASDYVRTDPNVTIFRLEQTCNILRFQLDTANDVLDATVKHWKRQWWFGVLAGLLAGMILTLGLIEALSK